MTLRSNKNEILWNLINSGLAGLLVLLGSFADGNISLTGFIAAAVAAGAVAINKFKDYWDSEKGEYSQKSFNFF